MYLACRSFKWVILKWTDPFFKLNKEHFTFHLEYKPSVTFARRKHEEHSYPKNPKICDLILVTLLKMRAHYSQSWSWKCGRIQRHIPISLLYIVPSSGTTTANICAYFKCIVSYCSSRQKINLVQHPWIMRGTHMPLVLVNTKLPTRNIQYIPVNVCSAVSLFQFKMTSLACQS